ncbi:hypothetical protein AGDE_14060 [Angomonas deanei]|uniref:Uncharacterized protein n=1 Tax=Angomonas deanei TaxID=59799 RepID=A0A7G2CIW6_9TRYP|nr:hypothetical protein AGDE_14060 [Angomonas deanei]CAD2219788.1 hypothetical protein, conserved [Angomonas deanei]|eukprot:EPY21471.1 hypothetical protein AGDE_14060 [Angomonas deanei]
MNRRVHYAKAYPTVRFTRKGVSTDQGDVILVSGDMDFQMCQDELNTTIMEGGKCTFHCVDPSVVGNGKSFDVNVEDLMLGDVAVTDVHSTERRVLTLQDTFRCEYMDRPRRFDLHKHFHSVDIWISQFDVAPPFINTTDASGKVSRLLPSKTLFWTGESLARFYVTDPCYLEQFDELVLLSGMTPEVYWKGIYGPSVAREMAASLKIRNWSMGHQHVSGFNVLLEVNRRLQDGRCARDALCGLPEGEEQQRRLSSTERVTRDVLQSYRSGSPLHLVDLSLSTDPALNTPALVRQRRVERWRARESAIAILLA